MLTPARRASALVLLLVIFAFNYVDRMVLGLVLQDIKQEFGVSDTALGLLSGLAFAFFYAVMGLPIAKWADRGNRVTIIASTTALWSLAVALCGFAGNFIQLLLIRIGVAVGEAGCVPPAHSLIADYYSRSERPRAMAIYMLGGPLSLVIGYFLAGWLNELFGWRMTFLLLGMPGLLAALLALIVLKEPRLDPELASPSEETQPKSPSMLAVGRYLWGSPTFRHLLVGISIMHFFSYGIGHWKPAFFIRSFELTTGELGTALAVIYGLGGLLGTMVGGEWAARAAAANEHRQLRATAVLYAALAVVSVGTYSASNLYWAFAFMGIAAVCGAAVMAPLFATIQTLVPEHMRARSVAIIYLFANLIGMGLGPLATGLLSDAYAPWAGQESLRFALLTLCPGYLWVGCHLLGASATVRDDIRACENLSLNKARSLIT